MLDPLLIHVLDQVDVVASAGSIYKLIGSACLGSALGRNEFSVDFRSRVTVSSYSVEVESRDCWLLPLSPTSTPHRLPLPQS